MTPSLREEIERGPQKVSDNAPLIPTYETEREFALRLVRLALEEAAGICVRIEDDAWKAYKTGNGPGRADSRTEGISDGAQACATLIRAFAATLTPGQELPDDRPACGGGYIIGVPDDDPSYGRWHCPDCEAESKEKCAWPWPIRSPNAQTERRKRIRRYLTIQERRNSDRRKANAQAPSPRWK